MGVRYPARVADRSRSAGAATPSRRRCATPSRRRCHVGRGPGRSWIDRYRSPLDGPFISAMMPIQVAQSGAKWGGEVKRSGRSTAVVAEVGDR